MPDRVLDGNSLSLALVLLGVILCLKRSSLSREGFGKVCIRACSSGEECVFFRLSPELSHSCFSLPSLSPMCSAGQPLPKTRGRQAGRAALAWEGDRHLPRVVRGCAAHPGSSDRLALLPFHRYRGDTNTALPVPTCPPQEI